MYLEDDFPHRGSISTCSQYIWILENLKVTKYFVFYIDIYTSAACLICVLFVFNATGRQLNASYTLIKYKNLLQTNKAIDDIASETIEEFVSID
jgi:hypothetical protein